MPFQDIKISIFPLRKFSIYTHLFLTEKNIVLMKINSQSFLMATTQQN